MTNTGKSSEMMKPKRLKNEKEAQEATWEDEGSELETLECQIPTAP